MLIFIHELGHYLMARRFHVTIKEFAIGMGPRLISRTSKKTGIAYSLRLLPIGGFVSMAGEDESSEDAGALNNKPVWQRLLITSAGAIMNILLGLILMGAVVLTSQSLGSTTIHSFQSENPEDSSTYVSGLREGDKIVKIGGTSVHVATDMVYEIMHDATKPIDVTVKRDGETITISDVEFPTVVSSGVTFGTVDFFVYSMAKTPLNIVKQAFWQSMSSVKMIWESLIDLVTGKYSIKEMSGPVGVTTAIGEAADEGTTDLLYLCALITLNLGIFNLLPLPALDGGRIVFQLVELVRGKPIKPEIEGYVHFAGIVLLMLLMVIVSFNDVMRLINGG